MTAGKAHAAGHSGQGWAQTDLSSGASASAEFAGYQFGIGYSAHAGVEGYNWDIAPNTVSVSCVAIEIEIFGIPVTIPITTCPTLPGAKLSTSVTRTPTTYQGQPAVKKLTTIVWDVPDSGAAVQVDDSLDVPLTLFSEDFHLLRLTAAAAASTDGADTLSASVYWLGAKVRTVSAVLPVNGDFGETCRTADVDPTYEWSVLGIAFDIHVSGSVAGCLGVNATASFTNAPTGRRLAATLTPWAKVEATFSASVSFDAVVASAEIGVTGDVTIVDARLPVSLSAAVTPAALTFTETARFTMTGLDGDLALYGEGCALGHCADLDWVIFDWNGLTFVNTTLFSESQTFPYYVVPQDPG